MVGTVDDLFSIRIVDRTDMQGRYMLKTDQADFWKIVDLKAFSLVEDPRSWVKRLDDLAREEAFSQIERHLESAAFYLTINGVGQAVGYAIGDVSQKPGTFEILDLYTHNPFRGKGFSKHIALRMLEHAARAGFSEVTAVIPEGNQRAIHAYESIGFKKVDEVVKQILVFRDGELIYKPRNVGGLYMKNLKNPASYGADIRLLH